MYLSCNHLSVYSKWGVFYAKGVFGQRRLLEKCTSVKCKNMRHKLTTLGSIPTNDIAPVMLSSLDYLG